MPPDSCDSEFLGRLGLPIELVTSELWSHYIGLQLRIKFEASMLGVEMFGLDFCDDDYWLEFRFEDWDQLEQFGELLEGVEYPSGVEWEAEERFDDMIDQGVALFMPRHDAYVAWKMMRRLAIATTTDEARRRTITEHEQRVGLQMEDWGKKPVPRQQDK